MYFCKKIIAVFLLFFSLFFITCASEKAPANKDENTVILFQNYKNKESHFSINYPKEWIVEQGSKGSVIFSGKKDTSSYFSTVNVQTLLTKKSNGEYRNVMDVIADIKKQILKESPKTTFLSEDVFEFTTLSGDKLMGRVLIFIYSYESHIIEQWQIVLPGKDGMLFYSWAYTSPLSQYSQDLPIAKAMLKSWMID